MSTVIPTLRGRNRADLVAMPAVLLGFHPSESLVAIGIVQGRVEFCARIDLVDLAEDICMFTDQLLNASANFDDCGFVLVGFGACPEYTGHLVDDVAVVLGASVRDCLVSDDQRYWGVGTYGLEPVEGIPCVFSESMLAADAVYQGVTIEDHRADAVRDVAPPTPRRLADLEGAWEEAMRWGSEADEEALFLELGRLVESSAPLDDAAATRLALLLDDPCLMGEVLSRLSATTAPTMRLRLLEARSCVNDATAPNVVGLLAVACWLDHQGAQQSECMMQLERLDPSHPVLAMLSRFNYLGIPPSRWDA